jgi:DNA-binding LacI/PurR family transcriptional regulator
VDDSPTLRQIWPTLSTMRYPMASVAKRVAAIVNGAGEGNWPVVETMDIVERGSVADYSV